MRRVVAAELAAALACALAWARAPARPATAEVAAVRTVRVVAARRPPEVALVHAPAREGDEAAPPHDASSAAGPRRGFLGLPRPESCESPAPPPLDAVIDAGCTLMLVSLQLLVAPLRLLAGDLELAPPSTPAVLAALERHARDPAIQGAAAGAVEPGPGAGWQRVAGRADVELVLEVETAGFVLARGGALAPFADVRGELRAGRRIVAERRVRSVAAEPRALEEWVAGDGAALREAHRAVAARAARALGTDLRDAR